MAMPRPLGSSAIALKEPAATAIARQIHPARNCLIGFLVVLLNYFMAMAGTGPRNTVIDALGRVNTVPESAAIFIETGGPSGSAWLFGPSLTQTYCSLP